jgi:hypothetical protein
MVLCATDSDDVLRLDFLLREREAFERDLVVAGSQSGRAWKMPESMRRDFLMRCMFRGKRADMLDASILSSSD